MQVKDVMTKSPQYISPNTTLQEAAKKMKDSDFGFIPVGENDRLIGMLTDRDITIRAVAEGKDPKVTKVGEVLTKNVIYCWENDTIEKAAEKMEKEQLRRLVVLNSEKRLTGILSLGDIARKCHNDELCGEIVEAVSEEAA